MRPPYPLNVAAWLPLLALACQRPPPQAPTGNHGDAPYELADSNDLAAMRDRYEALPDGGRGALRGELVAEYGRRAQAALEKGDPDTAYAAFTRLVSLFSHPDDFRPPPRELVSTRALAENLRAVFATRGGDREAVLCLFVLDAIDQAADHLGEVEAIFRFSDELAIAEFGEGAERSRSLEALEATVAVAPIPAATSRLIAMYGERHAAVAAIIGRGDLSYELIGAHGQGLLETSWNIVRVGALARRLDLAATSLVRIKGFDDGGSLRGDLAEALASDSPEAFIALANNYDGSVGETQDLAAGSAILELALAKNPGDRSLLRAAGKLASKNNQIERAIALLELGTGGDDAKDDRSAAAELASLYEFRVTTLSLTGRPAAARAALSAFERFYGRSSAIWSDFEPDLANAYAAMGRGLLSQGDLRGAEAILGRSLDARTTLEALEHLGTLALRRGEFERAASLFARALALPAEEPSMRFNRTKLLRLAGEALLGAGHQSEAQGVFRTALDEWRTLRSSKTYELRAAFAAESLVETGKLHWHLGRHDIALSAFAAAQDIAPGESDVYAAVVSFLIVRDRYNEALEAYHRALGRAEVSDYFKVYMSLWITAEARRQGTSIDPFARDFLASRDGELWYDDLARFASGTTSLAPLKARANTKARRAEFLYYTAVLGAVGASAIDRRTLLRDVVATDMVMFFEYEMAKHWLERGFEAE